MTTGFFYTFVKSLQPGTSDVDWCEPNYAVSGKVAEYYNTVSNLPYLCVPLVMMYMFRSYGQNISPLCHLVFALLIVVGLGSAYFHGALSLAGQLIDEIAILWVLAAAAALWLPRYVLPAPLAKNRRVFRYLMLLLTVSMTCLGCLIPVVNHVVLMCLSIPITTVIWLDSRRSSEAAVRWLGTRCMYEWIAAFSCWISDRTMCGFWIELHFPYLHSIWHVIMVFAAYDILLFLAYNDAAREFTRLQPELLSWPTASSSPLVIMYIAFKSPRLPRVTTDTNYNKLH